MSSKHHSSHPKVCRAPLLKGMAVVLCLATLLACSLEPVAELVSTHDLVAELAVADQRAEVRSFDFGTPEARRTLGTGWSADEVEATTGRPFVWGVGEASVLQLPIFTPRDLDLVIRCRPFLGGGTEPPQVVVELGDEPITTLDLRRGRQELRIRLPEERLVAGLNRLVFRYLRSAEARPSPRRDRRDFVLAFERLTLEENDGSEPATVDLPQADLASRRLFVPVGNELIFHFDLVAGSHLAADRWSFRGGAGLQLRVDDLAGRQVLSTVLGPDSSPRVELPVVGPARLMVRSLATAGQSAGGAGVALDGPRIVAPSPTTQDVARVESTTTPPDLGVRGGAEPPIRSVVLYLIDTLRADHLGCYGHDGGLTPEIDAWASEAVVFEQGISQSSWTRASVASILTGLDPIAHGTNRRNQVLGDSLRLLTEILADQGYDTAAFISNPNLAAEFGFDRGFEVFEDLGSTEVDGTVVVERATAWLEERRARADSRPFFLLVHTIDPHSPYDPPADLRARFAPEVPAGVIFEPEHARRERRSPPPPTPSLEQMRRLYEAEVAASDLAFGQFRSVLDRLGLTADLGFFLLSDHGEEFREHGNLEHGKELFGESVRVPFVLRLGDRTAPTRRREVVQHLDVLPTVLEALGLSVPEGLTGRSLVSEVVAAEPSSLDPDHPVVTYLHLDGEPRIALRDGDWKVLYRIENGDWLRPRLYHLPSDPGELHNLAADEPVRLGVMTTRLRRHHLDPEGRHQAGTTELDDVLRQRLEALGYL